MDNEQLRGELRRDFIKILRTCFESKSSEVSLFGNKSPISANVLAFDRDTIQMVVSPFDAPNNDKLPSAILRLTDVESVKTPLNQQ